MPRKGPDLRKSRHNPNVPDLQGPPETTLTIPGQHSFVRPLASEPNPIPPPVSLDIRGKIGQTVYQRTLPWISHYEHGTEKMLQRRRHVIPPDPRTHLQLLNRSRFAAAVQGWKILTTEQRAEYNRRGAAKDPAIEGLNVWIREFISQHALSEFQLQAEIRAAQPSLPIFGPGP
jgi:hypothetical protein